MLHAKFHQKLSKIAELWEKKLWEKSYGKKSNGQKRILICMRIRPDVDLFCEISIFFNVN